MKDNINAPHNQTLMLIDDSAISKRIYINIIINNKEYKALLDTGATISVLGTDSDDLWTNLVNINKNSSNNVIAANGQQLKCNGLVKIHVKHNNQKHWIKMLVIPEVIEQIILGMNFFHAFKMQIAYKEDQIAAIEEQKEFDKYSDLEMSDVQRIELKKAISEFLFSSDEFVGCQTIIKHHIDTGDNKAVCQRLYQYSPEIEEQMKHEVDRWIKLGYIEPSNTDWRHPIVPVPKKNGKIRLCLDARKLNAITKRDTYISPDLNNIFRRFPQAKLFFSVDLTDAFMQTELTDESKEKTAFGIPGKGTFQYKRMPFGLKNSAATQSRVMNAILGEDLEPKVFHYLDDVVIAAENFNELVYLIRTVAKRLASHGLTVNPEKLEGPCTKIKFIGRVFDCEGQHPEVSKVEAITKLPTPKTVKEVRSLVGTVTWYAHFIKNFSSLLAPITSLIKKKAQKVVWTDEAESAFEKVKAVLTSEPVLRAPSYNKPFIIQCDASQKGIGGVLAQCDEDGKEYVISYYSHKLTSDEQKYHTYERECLAVLKSLDHFKPYTYLQPLIIMTDHHSLTQTLNYKGKSGRLLRWSLLLQPHAHQIIHRAGNQMVVADALSRATSESQEVDEDNFKYYHIDVIFSEITDPIEPITEAEIGNANGDVNKFEILRKKVMTNPTAHNQYRVQQNRLLFKTGLRNLLNEDWKEVPHPSQRNKAIEWAHNDCLHGGIDKTLDKLKEHFHWKKMIHDVKKKIKCCIQCAQVKAPNYISRGVMPIFRIPEEVGIEIQIDFKGPFPKTTQHNYRFIVVAQEALSRYLIASCLTRANVDNTIRFLEQKVFTIFPNIRRIKHDRGSQFMSEVFKNFLTERNIIAIPTAAYAPHQNPVERANRVIGEALTIYMLKHPESHTNWHRYVDIIINKINSRKHDATKLKPIIVVYGRELTDNDRIPVNDEQHREIIRVAYENSKKSYELRKREYNKHATIREFLPDTWVLAKYRTLSSGAHNWMSKLAAKYQPVKIIRKRGHNTYEVEDIFGGKSILDVRSIKNVVPELNDILRMGYDDVDE